MPLLEMQPQLIAIGHNRTDHDGDVARWAVAYNTEFHATLSHIDDVASLGTASSEKKVKGLARESLRAQMNRLRVYFEIYVPELRRMAAGVTVPALALELRAMLGVLRALEDDMASCLPPAAPSAPDPEALERIVVAASRVTPLGAWRFSECQGGEVDPGSDPSTGPSSEAAA